VVCCESFEKGDGENEKGIGGLEWVRGCEYVEI
jgi:hypothetical protein